MKKYTLQLSSILVASLLFAGCVSKAPVETAVQVSPPEDVVQKNETLPFEGQYLVFTPEVLEENAETRRVLFFYANWCPTCASANKNFLEHQSEIPENVTLIRTNYNDTETNEIEKKLAQEYAVTYQHTFVEIDKSGKLIQIWNGGEINELLAHLK